MLRDDDVRSVVGSLRRRRGGGEELLAWREHGRWYDVTSGDINHYLHDVVGEHVSAKDFRTWHGTVVAAAALAAQYAEGSSKTAQKRQVVAAMKQVAAQLGNTPTVARNSYVDPRLVDRFNEGLTIRPTLAELDPDPANWTDGTHERVENAVLRLIEASDAAAEASQDAEQAQRAADRAAARAERADAEVRHAVEGVADEVSATG